MTPIDAIKAGARCHGGLRPELFGFVDSIIDQARDVALEEAAAVAENIGGFSNHNQRNATAAAIRALKDKP